MSEEEKINIYDNSRLFQDKTYSLVIMSYGGIAIIVWIIRNIILIIQNIILRFIPENTNEVISAVKSNILLLKKMWNVFIPYVFYIGLAYIICGLLILKWKKIAKILLIFPSLANLLWYFLLMFYFHNNILYHLAFTENLSHIYLYLLFAVVILFVGFWIGLMPIINLQYVFRSVNKQKK